MHFLSIVLDTQPLFPYNYGRFLKNVLKLNKNGEKQCQNALFSPIEGKRKRNTALEKGC
jgi:hypothetical protein